MDANDSSEDGENFWWRDLGIGLAFDSDLSLQGTERAASDFELKFADLVPITAHQDCSDASRTMRTIQFCVEGDAFSLKFVPLSGRPDSFGITSVRVLL